jgi:hypothetical protein
MFRVSVPGTDNFWHESFPEEWNGYDYATLDFLYTLKISHSFWEINGTWDKHAADIYWLQKNTDVEFLPEVYDIVYPVWKELHGKKKTNLAQGKQTFFADAVVRKYDHDSLHDSVCYHDEPWYLSILKDGEEVLTDWEKFMALPYESQLQLVREEIYATALERIVIPKNYKVSPQWAYAWALRRTATSLFKGKWALWLMLHYSDVFRADMDYVARHKSRADRLILL